MQNLHLGTVLWLQLVGGPCWFVVLPLFSLVGKERGLGNGRSMDSTSAKRLSLLSKYT